MALSVTQVLTLSVTAACLGLSAYHFKGGRRGLAVAFLGYSAAHTGMFLVERNQN